MRRALTVLAIATALAAAPKQPPLGLDAYMPTPPNNPMTAEKAALGRKLFFDKRLSLDNTVSCATCHDPELAFTDREAVAVGDPRLVYERGEPWESARAFAVVVKFRWLCHLASSAPSRAPRCCCEELRENYERSQKWLLRKGWKIKVAR